MVDKKRVHLRLHASKMIIFHWMFYQILASPKVPGQIMAGN